MKKIIFTILSFVLLVNTIFAQHDIWTAEAEDATLTGSFEVKTGCANASGDFVNLGSETGSSIIFSNISISEAGNYILKIYRFNANPVALEVFINDASVGVLNFPSANWCYEGSAVESTHEVTLATGANKIELVKTADSNAPFVDRIALAPLSTEPKKFYVSTSGNDNNNGLTPETAWQTLEKVSYSSFYPGDSVFFKSGDTFVGNLLVNSSGTEENVIYFGKYGVGDKPIINASGVEGGDLLQCILVENQSYIEIADLELTNDRKVSRTGVSENLSYGIYLHNSSDEIIRHFRFHDIDFRDIFPITLEGVEFNAIKVSGVRIVSEKNTVAGKEKNIQDVIVEDCYFERMGRYGIHTAHAGGDTGIGNDSINRNMNLIFRNNHFYQTGGTCIMPGRAYNCLVENNIFDYPGSNVDPRMPARGSGAWYWSSQNVISQYNKSYHVRGSGDSYGQHIDFGNKNIILQYNYSEDSEGGFVEILGKNINSVYRFNVSVNDNLRDFHGYTLWVSDYAGSGNKIRSDMNYIYNNSIYMEHNAKPDINIVGKNTYVYNNIFHVTGMANLGSEEVLIDIEAGSEFKMSNNLFYGTIAQSFKNYDENPVYGDPLYTNAGALNIAGYTIEEGSPAINAGISFPEPEFPNAGKGIFKDISLTPGKDIFGNPVSVSTAVPNIGACNLGNSLSIQSVEKSSLRIYPNPVKEKLNFTIKENSGKYEIYVADIQGKKVQSSTYFVNEGQNVFEVDKDLRNGVYFLIIGKEGKYQSRQFVLVR